MSIVSDLAKRAYYIAGIKSAQSGELPSAAEQTNAFEILNNIIDSFRLIGWFNSFLFTLTIDNPEQNIYIGRTITGGTGITVVDEDPMKIIFGASWTNSDSNYPLIIKNLADKTQTPIITETGNPAYLFWANQLQDDKVFSNLFLYPGPNQPSILNLSGFSMQEEYATETDAILPTFFNFLLWQTAKDLAANYGTIKVFKQNGQDELLEKYKQLLMEGSPVDSRPNDMSILLNRNYASEYPYS